MTERSSLVHERCIKCAGPLPCVLHDRELLRSVLNLEREAKPKPEKAYRIDGVGSGRLACVWVSDSEFFTVSKNENKLCRIKYDQAAKQWKKAEDVSFLKQHQKIVGLKDLGNRRALISTSHRDFILIEISSGIAKVVAERKAEYKLDVAFGKNVLEGDRILPFRLNVEYKKRCLFLRLTPEGFFSVVGSNGESLPRNNPTWIHKLADGSILYSAKAKGEFHRIFPLSDSFDQWQEETLTQTNGSDVTGNWHTFADLDQNHFAAISSEGISIVRFDIEQNKWSKTLISKFEKGTSSRAMRALSPDSFVFHKSSDFGDTHALDLCTRDEKGVWNLETIDELKKTDSDYSIVKLPIETDSFFVFSNGRATLYRIPPAKLHAYHERQAAQTKVPPLPSDL